MIVSGYTMDLYCRNADPRTGTGECRVNGSPTGEFRPHTFIGRTFADCKRQAQKTGWTFGRDGDVTCRRCSKARRAPLPVSGEGVDHG